MLRTASWWRPRMSRALRRPSLKKRSVRRAWLISSSVDSLRTSPACASTVSVRTEALEAMYGVKQTGFHRRVRHTPKTFGKTRAPPRHLGGD